MAKDAHTFHFSTRAIHAGEKPDPATGASAPNIVMSTTFVTEPGGSFSAEDFGEGTPFIYTRWGNPTVDQLERKLASLEEAEACVAFGSGMAAITALFLHVLKSGDHLVISDVTYAATAEFSKDFLPRFGIEVTKVDLSDPGAANLVRPGPRAGGIVPALCRGWTVPPFGGAGGSRRSLPGPGAGAGSHGLNSDILTHFSKFHLDLGPGGAETGCAGISGSPAWNSAFPLPERRPCYFSFPRRFHGRVLSHFP